MSSLYHPLLLMSCTRIAAENFDYAFNGGIIVDLNWTRAEATFAQRYDQII